MNGKRIGAIVLGLGGAALGLLGYANENEFLSAFGVIALVGGALINRLSADAGSGSEAAG